MTTVAGNGTSGYSGDGGSATAAELQLVSYSGGGHSVGADIVFDNTGNLYLSDIGNGVIRMINSSGVISTVAGKNSVAGTYNGDGIQATAAALYNPKAIAIDGGGNLLIADAGNYRIRKVNSSGLISTIAGTGYAGINPVDDQPATADSIGTVDGLAVDHSGNIYFCDASNYVIKKISSSGAMSTVAGTGIGGYNGDHIAATNAEIFNPRGLAVDTSGNIYFADAGNNRVRRIDGVTGFITTVAGNGGVSPYAGDTIAATSATLYNPFSVTVDAIGNLYIADESDNRIRKVNSAGIITTVAGTGVAGYNGDGALAIYSYINVPSSAAVNSNGDIFIADTYNSRVRKVNLSAEGVSKSTRPSCINVSPNPSHGSFG